MFYEALVPDLRRPSLRDEILLDCRQCGDGARRDARRGRRIPFARSVRGANDLGDDRALIVVSAAWNRSKADQDPTTWLPPAEGYRCLYVTDWVADKTRWGRSIDPAEQAALSEELSACPDAPITVADPVTRRGMHGPRRRPVRTSLLPAFEPRRSVRGSRGSGPVRADRPAL